MRLIVTAVVCSILMTDSGWGQDASERNQIQRWVQFYKKRISQYEVVSIEDEQVRLDLHGDPLLTYTNPVRGHDQHGAVFVWTRRRRPCLLGTIWSIAGADNPAVRRTAHEVHSLASFRLRVECPASSDPQATRAIELAWNLEQVQGEFSPTDRAKAPAKSRPLRLVQMRRIASEFSAVSIDRKDQRTRPLRLMPTPLMRFQSLASGVIDGCLFAFVLATDPELLIMIEALDEPAEGGLSNWRVTPAPVTGTELRLNHGDDEIWRCEKIDYRSQSGPYRLHVGVSELPATRDEVK